MDSNHIQILLSIILYLAVVIGVSFYFARRSNANSDSYFIGGRGLGPWVTAMSAEASDMSGWLLMGLPGVAYWCGISDAAWTAIGLAIGTYINWLLVSQRLRRYSVVAGNSITIPDFFSNRYKEGKPVILLFASIFILIFFTVYASSCFVTGGKLFNAVFGVNYQLAMVLSAIFVIVYTLIGGFLAESTSDFIQSIVMIFALASVFIIGTATAGGPSAVLENVREIPGFLEFFGIATPTVDPAGLQQLGTAGEPLFGDAGAYGLLTIISTMSWGLGYFGMPQVLLRFMAIRKLNELRRSRRIAIIWVVIALFAAVVIGIIGRSLYPGELLTASASESIFIHLSTVLLHPILAGIVMSGILAATMSSSDSYMLIASSAVSLNLFKGIFKKDATDKQIMIISRVTLIVIAAVGILFVLDENSVIFTIVSFAWAGFGATFGPLMLFSLFWKRTTKEGALAGMIGGAAMVFFWKLVLRPLGGVLGIYELLPAFVFSCLLIVIVSLSTKAPSDEIRQEFEKAKDKTLNVDAEEAADAI
ncbi:MAG: sodium/proline symporter PutP [Clostridiales Family XIII bacterium]|jgi:sodium/proline symporter|nr:sodium/proline symporter PutP [Clostridiales Family XIII bacterium]